ncbi:MAG: 4Fe-4S binding protein [Bacteroidales bacterium]|nr:4Fe-4S binding protein [Bacteroidales bacterium]MDD2425079.1 4Fe-4S binding protein [Bacteroidales bacterium]MDD3988582.1 4Fe-4S binding protein [Bacteroidales bacterium]MDD4638156.1 4Fe-4S binding protein [Bacteroidales bacterium]
MRLKHSLKQGIFSLLIIISPVLTTVPASAQSQILRTETSVQTQEYGDIWEYRENYVPVEYNPIPEFMVFADMTILIFLIIIGLMFVIGHKPSRWLSVLAIISLIYLGILRGGCICPVGAVTNITMGILSPEMVGLATVIIFLTPLIIALIAGRIFCTSGCPIGAIQHLMYSKKRRIRIPEKINKILRIVPVLILAATIYAAVYSKYYLICELEPYKAIFFLGKSWTGQIINFITGQSVEAKLLWAMGITAWIYLAVILIIGFWIPRPFCRFICPYGVLLGFFSMFSIKRRSINGEKCNQCGLCQRACPVEAISVDRKGKTSSLSHYDCIQCNKCTDACKKGAIVFKGLRYDKSANDPKNLTL